MADGPSLDEIRAINARMVAQLLAEQPQPLAEGQHAVRVLESSGRASGQPRRTPLGVTQVEGCHYLVSPDRGRDWVRNLAAEPRCALVTLDGPQPQIAVPVTGPEAAAAIGTYLSTMRVPWAVRAFPVAPDSTREQILAHLDTIAVFRLDPTNGDGR
ncbi:F420H(2)-dependent quinone reductase [Kutzneria sp. CA-103260]|nr:F420H(2)-dependent quinone reductase [Kutzneria sp. CA-103260]